MVSAVTDALGQVSIDVDVLVVEQQIIAYGRTKNPADMLEVNGVAGALVGAITAGEYHGYLPSSWKGSTKKEVFTARIEAQITVVERAVIEPCPASLKHNLLDAIGLGKYHLSRS